MTIRYYTNQKNLKNKAKNGLVTFDWFKKHFVLPLDFEKFEELPFEEDGDNLAMPQFKSIISFFIIYDGKPKKIQGRIEGIIREIPLDENYELVHILLQEITTK